MSLIMGESWIFAVAFCVGLLLPLLLCFVVLKCQRRAFLKLKLQEKPTTYVAPTRKIRPSDIVRTVFYGIHSWINDSPSKEKGLLLQNLLRGDKITENFDPNEEKCITDIDNAEYAMFFLNAEYFDQIEFQRNPHEVNVLDHVLNTKGLDKCVLIALEKNVRNQNRWPVLLKPLRDCPTFLDMSDVKNVTAVAAKLADMAFGAASAPDSGIIIPRSRKKSFNIGPIPELPLDVADNAMVTKVNSEGTYIESMDGNSNDTAADYMAILNKAEIEGTYIEGDLGIVSSNDGYMVALSPAPGYVEAALVKKEGTYVDLNKEVGGQYIVALSPKPDEYMDLNLAGVGVGYADINWRTSRAYMEISPSKYSVYSEDVNTPTDRRSAIENFSDISLPGDSSVLLDNSATEDPYIDLSVFTPPMNLSYARQMSLKEFGVMELKPINPSIKALLNDEDNSPNVKTTSF